VRHRLLSLIMLLLLAMVVSAPLRADTGTYRILNYTVKLTPHSDGKVDIDYYQKWQVTGGQIPWITVGVPNADFTITQSGLAVQSARPANEGDWSGVRLDLNKDYRQGQTFEISFSISQNRLFYADNENYKLDFTPGWYDRAEIANLEIRLKSFAKPETVQATPEPTSKTDEELVWNKTGMKPGERFSVSYSFPKAVLPSALPQENMRDESAPESSPNYPDQDTGTDSGGLGIGIFIFIVFIIIIFLRFFFPGGRRRSYTGGSIFWNGLIDILSSGSSSGDSDRHTGGGGGFGGGGFSCACACASCACACACAGGGGAGCSRKLKHSCHICAQREKHNAPTV
jgi:hypothetical protein